MFNLRYQTEELERQTIMLVKTGFKTAERANAYFNKWISADNISRAWIEKRCPGDIELVKELRG